ncbi:hypothetical protein ACFQLX_09875 [Streptomyces polyrhachis]|uniref:Lipoprotein n=1 Tax=Streptomyces polyrhachis TaxID=1282885 RepID=A0ABW2GEW2_9ACTN
MRRARISLITACAAAVVAACASCGGNAYAQGEVIVSPAQARPGTEVEIRTSGCKGDWATARSEAFVTEAQLSPSPDGYALWGQTRVSSSAQPRPYDVRVRCDDGTQLKGRFTVSPGQPPPPQPQPGQWQPRPWRPVHAGGGGTAPKAERAASPAEREVGALAAVRGQAVGYADEFALGAGAATLVGFAGRRVLVRRRGGRGGV